VTIWEHLYRPGRRLPFSSGTTFPERLAEDFQRCSSSSWQKPETPLAAVLRLESCRTANSLHLFFAIKAVLTPRDMLW
jgi:hypothetical protein